MLGKYGQVIDYLKSGGVSLQRVYKDCVLLSSKSMTWHLDYASNNLEVRMKGFMPMLGEINKKWIFPDRYPQQKMIQEIEDYMDWQMNQFQKAVKNNPYKHLNYN